MPALFRRRSRGSQLRYRVLGIRLERASLLIVFVEHDLGDLVGRPVEPALGFGGRAGECPAPGGVGTVHGDAVDADGYDRARADVGAAPLPTAAPECPANAEICVFHSATPVAHGGTSARKSGSW